MTKLIVYYDLISQPCRALYMFLRKTNIPFEGKVVEVMKGEQFSSEFVAVNPLKKVPVVNDKGFILTESIAILRYLCRSYNVADHWYPKDSVKQARVDEYMEWQHNNTRANCGLYYLHKVVWPTMSGKPPNEKRISQLYKDMANTLDLIENIWLKDKLFLSGNEISISDIIGISEIDQTRMTGYDPFANRPNLTQWKKRIVSNLSPYYEEVSAIVDIKENEYNSKFGQLNSKI